MILLYLFGERRSRTKEWIRGLPALILIHCKSWYWYSTAFVYTVWSLFFTTILHSSHIISDSPMSTPCRPAYWAIFCSTCGRLCSRCLCGLTSERYRTAGWISRHLWSTVIKNMEKWWEMCDWRKFWKPTDKAPIGDGLLIHRGPRCPLPPAGLCDGAGQAVFSRRAETACVLGAPVALRSH